MQKIKNRTKTFNKYKLKRIAKDNKKKRDRNHAFLL